MGVWIEISDKVENNADILVTPCMGVWIEIIQFDNSSDNIFVTPCMGVWIEIFAGKYNLADDKSLPVWECGLKLPSWKM